MMKLSQVELVLNKLEDLHHSLERDEAKLAGEDGGPIDQLVEETGYSAVHVARRATEDFYRKLHDVSDIAPDLKDDKVYGSSVRQARGYLRAGISACEEGSPKMRALRAVANLVEALKAHEASSNDFRVATEANEVAIILLGPRRLGGVYAEWQASTLGVGLFTWIEQQSLNLRVHGLAEQLDKELAGRDAEKYELPGIDFIKMGSYGNIAKACFRAVAEQECAGFSAQSVAATGAKALQEIESGAVINPGQFREYILAMMAMSAAVQEYLGQSSTFWSSMSAERTAAILRDIQGTEPSRKLRDLVRDSARRASA